MTRPNRHLVALAVVALALVATVLWVGRRDYVRDPPSLVPLDPAAITRIELTIPPLASQAFERRPSGWWRVAPSGARADSTRVERLAQLAATPVTRWLPAAGIAPQKIGLAPPSATLVLNGVRLEYGGLTAIGDLRYVRTGHRIALVPRQYSPEVTVK